MMGDWHISRVEEAIADIAAELARRPMTRDGLCEALLMNSSRVAQCVKKMKAARQIHVCDWRRTAERGHYAQVWALGDKPDAAKPVIRTKLQMDRDRRARLKAAAAAGQQEQAERSVVPNAVTAELSWIPRRAA